MPARPKSTGVNLLSLGEWARAAGAAADGGRRHLLHRHLRPAGKCGGAMGVRDEPISLPGAYDAMPPVEAIEPEELFAGDVFLFCASRFVRRIRR